MFCAYMSKDVETDQEGPDMKGFVFVTALAGLLFPLKALFARRKAKSDPVDIESLKKVDFRHVDGN